MKTCIKCGETKAPTEFYDGDRKCKPCRCAMVRERRRNDESVREYDRDRAKQPHNVARRRQNTAAWREQHPAAYRAQTAVGNAIRDGKLKKEPCLFCGTAEHVHAHHRDYSVPLDVTWLCAKCHHRLHANFPETEGHGARA